MTARRETRLAYRYNGFIHELFKVNQRRLKLKTLSRKNLSTFSRLHIFEVFSVYGWGIEYF